MDLFSVRLRQRLENLTLTAERNDLCSREIQLCTALDWEPKGARLFQIISVYAEAWGHVNWYSQPIGNQDLLQMIGRQVSHLPHPVTLALIDAVSRSHLSAGAPHCEIAFAGPPNEKTERRHEFIVSELNALCLECLKKPLSRTNVLTAGYFCSLQSRYEHRFGRLRWNDLRVDGKLAIPTREDEVLLISGSSLTEGNLGETLDAARQAGCLCAVLAQSCPFAAPYVLDGLCELVISELYPFFFMDGPTQMKAYRSYKKAKPVPAGESP